MVKIKAFIFCLGILFLFNIPGNVNKSVVPTNTSIVKADESLHILIGRKVMPDRVYAYINSSHIMVPAVSVFKELAINIKEDKKLKTITAVKNKISIKLTANSNLAIINNKTIKLSTSCEVVNNCFFIPDDALNIGLNEKVSIEENQSAPSQWKKYVHISLSNLKLSILNLRKDTEHFTFQYSSIDSKCIKDIEVALEDGYKKVCDDLGHKYTKKLLVKVYPSMQELLFDNDMYGNIAGVALVDRDVIIMVSPLAKELIYKGQLSVPVHEFIHKVELDINPNVPPWLNEGIAYFEAGQIEVTDNESFRKQASKGLYPNIMDDCYNYDSLFNTENWIPYVYSFVNFIVQEYGYDKLNKLLRDSSDYYNIFNESKNTLMEKWSRNLKKCYK